MNSKETLHIEISEQVVEDLESVKRQQQNDVSATSETSNADGDWNADGDSSTSIHLPRDRMRAATFSVVIFGILSAQWTVVVVAMDGSFSPNIASILTASIFMMLASVCVGLWIYSDVKRTQTMTSLKRERDAEKAGMVIKSAQEAAKIEQELNNYIAHEVRNPLSAAMTACTFVKTTITENNVTDIQNDVQIIDSSLRFINDLLRSMLDMHKTAASQSTFKLEPLDIMKDLLEPVAAMLYTRDSDVQILTDCPEGLVIMTDATKLKQILLNLGRNSSKFVKKGYIKFCAIVVDGHVQLVVEDSGPGIPMEKQKYLFSKFQESLDDLNQGTGIGLCLCKKMVELLGGEVTLDQSYVSNVEGYPGTRFIVDTRTQAMSLDEYDHYLNIKGDELSTSLRFLLEEQASEANHEIEDRVLPETLSVLFVDDDLILRRLFTRSVRKIAQSWNIQEASSGEIALKMVEDETFDIIFIDQYMASVEKQLLGTETTRALRAKGVKSRICGLSANDVENGFFKAGADFFMPKPFPCEKEVLRQELLRIIYAKRNSMLHEGLQQMSEGDVIHC